ncbi:C2 calcium-dependent domain-containing protein 4D [Ambystoma mexicanum]|uniref:C2 calcium-dependent domain-containing protein 4D n=1 Tax=Ambystoma mexicanum TaxID=8296 RepID=UPI0037E85396
MWFLEKRGWSLGDLATANSNSTDQGLVSKMFCSNRKMSNSRHKPLAPCPNVLTPDRIPKFFIPPKLAAKQARISSRGPALESSGPLGSSAELTSSYKALIKSANRHIIQIENTDEDSPGTEEQSGQRLNGACSMPHLAGCLPESPHTRRRESLFHTKGQTYGLCGPSAQESASNISSPDFNSSSSLTISSPDLRPPCQVISSPYYSSNFDSDTTSSTESSPFNSPLLTRSLAGTLVCQAYTKQRLFCRTLNVKTLARASSLSTEETSSTDNSPNIQRRENGGLELGHPITSLAPPPIFHLDFICCHERLTKENTVNLSKGGRLRLSAEYMKEIARLRIRLVSAEDLYQPHFESKNVNCCVMLHLQPGKVQKQRSTIIKNSKNPIFNEDFFFEGVFEEELDSRSIKVKVVNKGSNLRRDFVLGDCELTLSTILPA